MGAGGSVHHSPRNSTQSYGTSLRTVVHSVKPGNGLEDGVGRVLPVLKSLSDGTRPVEEPCGTTYGWFVESVQYPGQWESYNSESSTRLEEAFLSQDTTCSVVHLKRSYTVDLERMVQLLGTGPQARKVQRAPCELGIDPLTGAETRQLVRTAVGDPFEVDDDDAFFSSSVVEGVAPVLGTEAKNFPQLKRSVYPLEGSIFNLALSPSNSPDGPLLVTGGRNGQAKGWYVGASRIAAEYTVYPPATVLNVVYDLHGQHLAVGTDDCKARIYKEGNPRPVHELCGHTGKVYGLSYTSSRAELVTGSMDSTLRLWDVERGTCTKKGSVQSSHVFSVKCSATLPHFGVSGGNDSLVTVHDFRIKSLVAMRCVGHKTTVWYVDIHSNDSQFASCGKDGTVRIWDSRNASDALFVFRHHIRAVHSVSYVPHSNILLSSGRDGRVLCYNTANGESVWQATAHHSGVFRVAYDTYTNQMLTCATDGSVNIWEWNAQL